MRQVCDPAVGAKNQFPVQRSPHRFRSLAGCPEVQLTGEKPYQFLLHDRDSIYASEFSSARKAMGLRILKTPCRAPQANALCERMVGRRRREGWDFLIPLKARPRRRMLKEWVAHYHKGRPHSSLGPGIPEPSGGIPVRGISGHGIPCGQRVVASAILGGLHHE
jgi:transposase InsO family protein